MKTFLQKITITTFLATIFSAEIFAKTSEPFSISSPDFKYGDFLTKKFEFNGFGCNQVLPAMFDNCLSDPNRFKGLDCNGQNIAPTIKWQNPPQNTKSFAFTIYDPDALTDSGWWHFILFNIPPLTKSIKNAEVPLGATTIMNDGAIKTYMGLCPSKGSGVHRYIFTIYALDVEKLDLPPTAPAGLASYAIKQHSIASARLVGFYERK